MDSLDDRDQKTSVASTKERADHNGFRGGAADALRSLAGRQADVAAANPDHESEHQRL